jgi:hypothetical protein
MCGHLREHQYYDVITCLLEIRYTRLIAKEAHRNQEKSVCYPQCSFLELVLTSIPHGKKTKLSIHGILSCRRRHEHSESAVTCSRATHNLEADPSF